MRIRTEPTRASSIVHESRRLPSHVKSLSEVHIAIKVNFGNTSSRNVRRVRRHEKTRGALDAARSAAAPRWGVRDRSKRRDRSEPARAAGKGRAGGTSGVSRGLAGDGLFRRRQGVRRCRPPPALRQGVVLRLLRRLRVHDPVPAAVLRALGLELDGDRIRQRVAPPGGLRRDAGVGMGRGRHGQAQRHLLLENRSQVAGYAGRWVFSCPRRSRPSSLTCSCSRGRARRP